MVSKDFQNKIAICVNGIICSSAGLCTTQDVDIFIRHMNNARYLRELDFARFHYYGLTGLYEEVKKHRGGAVQGATSVRYRRTIPIFSAYRIETKVCFIFIELLQFWCVFFGFVVNLVGRESHLSWATIHHDVGQLRTSRGNIETVYHQCERIGFDEEVPWLRAASGCPRRIESLARSYRNI